MKEFNSYRLVKSEDLNHHGTLFAGRTSEWFVESGFIAAAHYLKPENIVCVKIHGMLFKKPVQRGDIARFSSKAVYSGKTSITAYIKVLINDETEAAVDGFITFVNLDENGKPAPHNAVLIPESDEEKKLALTAKSLLPGK